MVIGRDRCIRCSGRATHEILLRFRTKIMVYLAKSMEPLIIRAGHGQYPGGRGHAHTVWVPLASAPIHIQRKRYQKGWFVIRGSPGAPPGSPTWGASYRNCSPPAWNG